MSGHGRHSTPRRSRAWLYWSLAIVLAGVLDLTLAHGASRERPPAAPVARPCAQRPAAVQRPRFGHLDYPARNYLWQCPA